MSEQRIDELESIIKKRNRQSNRLFKKNEELEARADRLERVIHEKGSELTALREKNEILQKFIDNWKEEEKTWEEEKAQLEAEKKELKEFIRTRDDYIAEIVELFDGIKLDGKEIVFIDEAINAVKYLLKLTAAILSEREKV